LVKVGKKVKREDPRQGTDHRFQKRGFAFGRRGSQNLVGQNFKRGNAGSNPEGQTCGYASVQKKGGKARKKKWRKLCRKTVQKRKKLSDALEKKWQRGKNYWAPEGRSGKKKKKRAKKKKKWEVQRGTTQCHHR